MKNLISGLFLLIFVSSCNLLQPRSANIRLVKVGEKEEVLIERKHDRTQIQTEVQPSEERLVTVESTNSRENSGEELILERTENKSLEYRRVLNESEKIEPEEVEPTDQQKVEMAMQADKQANTSFYLFLSGLISVIMPYVGIFLFGIGLYFFAKARNARFITPEGESRLNIAKVFLVIDSVILLLWLLLIVFLILIF